MYSDLFESYFNAAICSSDNPVYLEISLGSILSSNIARAVSSCFSILPLSFAKAIWFRMSRSVVMSFRYLILSSGAKLCKSAEENNRSKISPSNPAGLPCYGCCLPVFCCAGKQRKAPEMRFGCATGDHQTESGGVWLRTTPSSHPVFPRWLLLFASRFV